MGSFNMVEKKYKLRDIKYDHCDNHTTNTKAEYCCRGLILTSCFLFVCATAVVCFALYQHRTWRNSVVSGGLQRRVAERVISCYYNMPSEHAADQLMPSGIDPNLCTHINLAFAQVVNNEISLAPHQYHTITEMVKLKHTNPDLKILVSVGGSGSDKGFPDMVLNHKSRKTFIKSVKYLLRNHSLDGIDLDWEFPALHSALHSGRERQHFSQLLREIRMEYLREKRDYLLTVAAAAPQAIVDISYDVDQLNLYVDYVNIMTYDFHYFTKYTPFTGFNSPLYSRSTEQLYLATLNINYTIHMYLDKGLDRNKIIVGIPTYGHTFSLVNVDNHQVSSPASGFGSLGSLGFINYPDVCAFVTTTNNVSITRDNEAKVSFLYKSKEWVSYEDLHSVMEKAKFIIENKLGGAMIYSLNADDYKGECRGVWARAAVGGFPLVVTVSDTLKNNGSSEQNVLDISLI
ncbi:hypothetical protein HW555_009575 [Spodoptera exigua]|uniref:GH18 domain-containing protein n=1 Tax=Spodoptera exigua TaxID=7107 RepID=A0A835L0N0_SPOEX|nr:hypothetical protein HW555_009575 [Spodoptera exigua]